MRQLKVEFYVGLFVIAGIAALAYMAVKMGDLNLFEQDNSYQVVGRFTSVSGLKDGASVELSGVKLGKVTSIIYDTERQEAVVTMQVPNTVKLSTDSIASVRTSGIIGDKYIKVTPGGEEDFMQEGDEFEQTESALDIEELISKFVFSTGDDK
ncbi:outer membrane lipid asymmetry maintenance protein MlaD [Pleionea sp. CnH1-48]|uniref:outer membrane lipid asymmetry maintenance protein MlaD n=1 Tax=Pleionea sp. CnH1-48 TaxID=2954494 RepID=UPI0020968251|nr:outer membrane lipid asymmetry maintenance protein MlaD [Pleionea sp. CnH1-48]MCO7226691.1 outer membrane lipid asymmetry maintenance protein MlaD [Pleionea sp. CnH1-48]